MAETPEAKGLGCQDFKKFPVSSAVCFGLRTCSTFGRITHHVRLGKSQGRRFFQGFRKSDDGEKIF